MSSLQRGLCLSPIKKMMKRGLESTAIKNSLYLEIVWNFNLACIIQTIAQSLLPSLLSLPPPPTSPTHPPLLRGHVAFHIYFTLLGSSSHFFSFSFVPCYCAQVIPAVPSPWVGGFSQTSSPLCPCHSHSSQVCSGWPGVATSSAAIPMCLPSSMWDGALARSPFLLQLPHQEKEEESSGIQCLLEWAALPFQDFECGVGLVPMPSSTLEQLGVIFAAGALKEQECSCPGLSSMWGLYRRSEVRVEQGGLSQLQGKGAGLV